MIVTVSSVGGSPGVTSWALLLAAAWPVASGRQRVMLEADPDGGVLGARYGIGIDPGVVGLVASCRRSEGLDVDLAGRSIGSGLWVVPSPESSEQVWPMWSAGASVLAERLAQDDRVWVVDVGRLSPGSPVRPIALAAAVNVLLSHGRSEAVLKLQSRVGALHACAAPTVVLLAGSSGHTVEEVALFSGADEVAAAPACDQLERLVSKCLDGGRSRRHVIWRTAVDLAGQLDRMTGGEPKHVHDLEMEVTA